MAYYKFECSTDEEQRLRALAFSKYNRRDDALKNVIGAGMDFYC